MYAQLYKFGRLAFPEGRVLQRRLQDLLRTQWLEPEELQALQLSKLRRLLDHAFTNVPFYRQRFLEASIHPNDIQTLDDLRSVPILTRDDVRRNLESMIASNFPRSELREERTGGSTGVPLKFYYSKERLYWSWAAFSRLLNWSGVENGCRTARLAPIPPASHPIILHEAKTLLHREKWLSTFDMSEDKMQTFAQLLTRFEPELIRGHNAALWLFAQYINKRGVTGIRPKVIIGGVDKIYDFERELIEETFGCALVDDYGSRETGQIAGQCPEGSLHVAGELHYLELINNGQPVEAGQPGEVVITELENYAMPFIRYGNGDVARLAGEPCRCGRGLPVLQELMGRKNGFFTTPEGKLVSGIYFVRKLREWPGIEKYRVHQPSVDRIDIFFKSDEEPGEDWLETQRREFRAHLGNSIQMTFTRVEEIPSTPAGKFLFTTSDVPVNLKDGVAC